jgi:hypothetical protein
MSVTSKYTFFKVLMEIAVWKYWFAFQILWEQLETFHFFIFFLFPMCRNLFLSPIWLILKQKIWSWIFSLRMWVKICDFAVGKTKAIKLKITEHNQQAL